MFLGVSGSVVLVAIDAADRARLGDLIQTRRERKHGTKKAAYQAAGVNAATWDKAEAGESVRPDLLRKIVRNLWPETEGDWQEVVHGPQVGDPSMADLKERVDHLEEILADFIRERRGEADPTQREGNRDDPGVSA
jgi:hypothetical protein